MNALVYNTVLYAFIRDTDATSQEKTPKEMTLGFDSVNEPVGIPEPARGAPEVRLACSLQYTEWPSPDDPPCTQPFPFVQPCLLRSLFAPQKPSI